MLKEKKNAFSKTLLLPLIKQVYDDARHVCLNMVISWCTIGKVGKTKNVTLNFWVTVIARLNIHPYFTSPLLS